MNQPYTPMAGDGEPVPAPGFPEQLAVSADSLMVLMNPLAASVIANNMQAGHFHRMDKRACKVFTIWNGLTGNQRPDGSPVVPFTQTILDGLTIAQHAIEFAAIATRRDLAGDGYHDTSGERLWIQPRHDVI